LNRALEVVASIEGFNIRGLSPWSVTLLHQQLRFGLDDDLIDSKRRIHREERQHAVCLDELKRRQDKSGFL
jgi:hypothetical protein